MKRAGRGGPSLSGRIGCSTAYGERYGRALMWVFLTWLVFAAAYACLDCPRPDGEETIKALMSIEWWQKLGYSLYFSLENLLPFKFSTNFLKAEGTTIHFLAAIETLFGTTLFTFFVLALRRRFREIGAEVRSRPSPLEGRGPYV